MAKRWYVVHVYSGFEKKIAEQIKQQAAQKGLADKFDGLVDRRAGIGRRRRRSGLVSGAC